MNNFKNAFAVPVTGVTEARRWFAACRNQMAGERRVDDFSTSRISPIITSFSVWRQPNAINSEKSEEIGIVRQGRGMVPLRVDGLRGIFEGDTTL